MPRAAPIWRGLNATPCSSCSVCRILLMVTLGVGIADSGEKTGQRMPRSGHSEHPSGVRHQFGMLSAFSVERCAPSAWNRVRHGVEYASCPWSLERPAHRALPAPTGTAAPASARAPWPLVPAAACSVRPGAAAHGCTARLRWLGPAADGANAPWSFTGTPWQACNRRNGVHALLEHLGVMSVCPANQDHQRDASGVYNEVSFGAKLASVRGVGARFLAPRVLGTEEPSMLAKIQSIW